MNNNLNELLKLEREHKVTGVGFAIKKGTQVTPEESVDIVINIINKSSKIIRDKSRYKNNES